MALTSSSVGTGATSSHSASAIVDDAVEGSHDLKIQGFSRTKGLRGCIDSATFVVGGRDWYIRYYPNGDDPKSRGWISLYLCHQNSSGTEVKARLALSLLDDTGKPVPSYSKGWGDIRSFKGTQFGWGYTKFIKRKTLEESGYIKDDCFRVRCQVMVLHELRAQITKKHRFVAVPSPDMHQHIGRLLCTSSSQVDPDVEFKVGRETISAHRLVLAARSPVFMAELFGPMKEKNMRRIRIDDMEARVFKAMLHFIYTDSLPDDDMDEADQGLEMAQHLLVAADRYDIQRLKLMCEDKLCNYINTSTVATNLALAEQHGCTGLKEACFEFLKLPGNVKAIMPSDGMQQLTSSYPSLLKELVVKLAP